MANLTIPEAAELIHTTLKTKLPKKYWLRFIVNHARPKSSDNPNAWCQMDVVHDGNKLVVKEESVHKFLEQAKDYEFPLKNINDGYNRKDNARKVRVVKKKTPEIIPKTEPESVPADDEYDTFVKEQVRDYLQYEPKTVEDKARAYDTLRLIFNLWTFKR